MDMLLEGVYMYLISLTLINNSKMRQHAAPQLLLLIMVVRIKPKSDIQILF